MAEMGQQGGYLFHINGLRAIAILAVLFYHLRSGYCPAGYFGVDVFLVISGFLLFRSLLAVEAAGRFHYGSYLLKKAWRTLPSWFFVTAAVCTLSLVFLQSSRLITILGTAGYSAVFLADYYIDHNGDYFNIYSQQNPLLHLWYLSITQQLYILAPLLLIPLARFCPRRGLILLMGLLAMLTLSCYIHSNSLTLLPEAGRSAMLQAIGSKSAYYHLIPRFWEIAAGAGILLLPAMERQPRLRSLLGLAGLIGLPASFFLCETGSPAVYLSVLSALLAIRYGDTGPAARLLGCKGLQVLGTISFSLYLWHWPVMVFWKFCCMDNPGPWDEAGMLLLSLALGALSWYAIERLRMPTRAGLAGGLLRASVILPPLVTYLGATRASNALEHTAQQAPLVTVSAPEYERDASLLGGLGKHGELLRLGAPTAPPSFLLIGDSHAGHLYDAFNRACHRERLRGIFLNRSLCPFWYLSQPPNGYDSCTWNPELAEGLLHELEQQVGIRHVIIALSWELRFSRDKGLDWRSGKPVAAGEERRALAALGLREFCERLKECGKSVIILGDTPMFPSPPPLDEWERCKALPIPYAERFVTQEAHRSRNAFSHHLFEALQAEGLAQYIDLAPALLVEGAYPARVDGQFLYQDWDHLSDAGEERALRYLMPRLLPLLRGQAARSAP